MSRIPKSWCLRDGENLVMSLFCVFELASLCWDLMVNVIWISFCRWCLLTSLRILALADWGMGRVQVEVHSSNRLMYTSIVPVVQAACFYAPRDADSCNPVCWVSATSLLLLKLHLYSVNMHNRLPLWTRRSIPAGTASIVEILGCFCFTCICFCTGTFWTDFSTHWHQHAYCQSR